MTFSLNWADLIHVILRSRLHWRSQDRQRKDDGVRVAYLAADRQGSIWHLCSRLDANQVRVLPDSPTIMPDLCVPENLHTNSPSNSLSWGSPLG